MGSPVIFNGSRTKLLTSAGLLTQAGRTIDYDGDTNYIANNGFEINTTGYAAFADAASSTPTDGTGGSPSVTITRSTSSPLVQTASGLFTKGASNLQGQGFSYDFTIDSAMQAKVCTISFAYKIASGTYADGDMSVWIYDVTNAVIIQPAPYTIPNVIGSAVWSGQFQTASNSTSYRLIFYVGSTSASAYTLNFDSVAVYPNSYNPGAAVMPWTAYTPTFSAGFGTTSSVNFQYRRVGSSVEIRGTFATGTTAGSIATMSLPSGLSVDTSVLSQANTSAQAGPQVGYWTGNTTNNVGAVLTATGTSATVLYFSTNGIAGQVTPQNGSTAFGNAMTTSVYAMVPIAGWTTTQILSSDTATNVVSAVVTGTPATWSANGIVIFPTVQKDSNGCYNASTGRYTVAVPGDYNVATFVNYNNGPGVISVYKNGSLFANVGQTPSSLGGGGAITVPNCVAGDILDVRASTSGGTPAASSVAFVRVSGPAQIAASEKVYALYTGNGGTSITANVTNIDFSTKVVDSHGAWNGTTFTAPKSGWYDFKGSWNCTTGAAKDSFLYINGTQKLAASYNTSGNAASFIMFVAGYFMNAGDTATFRSDTTATLSNSATLHWISITSQG